MKRSWWNYEVSYTRARVGPGATATITHMAQEDNLEEATKVKLVEELDEGPEATGAVSETNLENNCNQQSDSAAREVKLAVSTNKAESTIKRVTESQNQKAVEDDTADSALRPVAPMLYRLWAAALDSIISTSIVSLCFMVCATGYFWKAAVAPADNSLFWQIVLEDATLIGILGYAVSVFGWTFFLAYFESSKMQATPGMRLAGIKSFTKAGKRLSFWHALYRAVVEPICLWIITQASVWLSFAFILGFHAIWHIKPQVSEAPTHIIILIGIVTAIATALVLSYTPLLRGRTQTLVDFVARRRVVRLETSRLNGSRKLTNCARALVFLLAPLLFILVYYLGTPSIEVPFLNNTSTRIVLMILALFHCLGIPFAFMVRSLKHWLILWLIYSLPVILFAALGPEFRRAGDHVNISVHLMAFLSLSTVFVLSAPSFNIDWKSKKTKS